MGMSVCLYVYMCTTCMPDAHKGQNTKSPEPGVIDGGELLNEFWQLNQDLQQEQPVLTTLGLSLQYSQVIYSW